MIKVRLNGAIADVRNDFEFDFVTNEGNPAGGILVDNITLELPIGGVGYNVVDDWLSDGKVFVPIPVEITHDTLGLLMRGTGHIMETDTEMQCDFIRLHVRNNFENFFDKASNLNTAKFLSKTNAVSNRELFTGANPPFSETAIRVMKPNNSVETLTAISSIFSLALFVYQAIYDLRVAVVSFNPLSPDAANQLVVIRLAIVKLIFILIYVGLMINSLIDAFTADFHHAPSINVYNFIKYGCEKLGYNFESKVLFDKFRDLVVVQPESLLSAETNNEIELDSSTFRDMTLMEFMKKIAKMFRLEIYTKGDTVYMNDLATYIQTSQTNFKVDAMNVPNMYRFNSSEIPSSYSISYVKDAQNHWSSIAWVKKHTVQYDIAEGELPNNAVVVDLGFSYAVRRENINVFDTIARLIQGITLGLIKIKTGGNDGFVTLSSLSVNDDIIFMGTPTKSKKFNKYTRSTMKELGDNLLILPSNLYEDYHKIYTPEGDYCFATYVGGISEQGVCSKPTLAKLLESNVAKDQYGNDILLTKHIYNATTNGHEFEYKVFGLKRSKGDNETNIAIPEITTS
jgi:hypothetical protein